MMLSLKFYHVFSKEQYRPLDLDLSEHRETPVNFCDIMVSLQSTESHWHSHLGCTDIDLNVVFEML